MAGDFTGAKLVNANWSNEYIGGLNIFTNADLTGVNFTNSTVSNNFTGATLVNAVLDGATMSYGRFDNANLTGASIAGTNLSNANWNNTTCPDGALNTGHMDNSCTGALIVGTLNGTVSFQGVTLSRPETIHLTVYQAGTSTVVATVDPVASASGAFSVNLMPGTYDIRVKHLFTLSRQVNGLTITANTTSSQAFGALAFGDADNDDQVTIVDFSTLRTNFNKAGPQ